jgi:pyruvate formate lyase activating enzyme
MLKNLIKKKLLDYIAMDVKYSPSDYNKQTNDKNALEKITESIKIIRNSGTDYEFRTTVVKGIHKIKDIQDIAKLIKGSKKYYIQNFRPGKTIDPSFDNSNSFTEQELEKMLKGAKRYVKNSYIR